MRANGIMGRHNVNKDLVKEITALKAQLRKLSSAMEAEANSGISRTLSAIESKSKDAIDSAIERAQEFIDEYGDNAREAAEALTEKAGEVRDAAAESLLDAVRSRPLSTVAAIAGIGFLAGYLWRRA
jgi:ElaB/YqjD/DUF883 family membrane-anchored ribosome-binding protein